MTEVAYRIHMVPGETVESWRDPEIEAYFRHSYVIGAPPPTSLSLDAHNPPALRAGRRFMWSIFHEGSVELRIKELLRVQIARLQECEY